MGFLALPLHYFYWHYILAWRDIWRIYNNFLWFWWHFFSVDLLLRTLFAPWKRLGEEYRQGFAPQAALETFAVNTMMRLVGLACRLVLLVFAAFFIVITLALGPIAAAVWLGMPLWWVMLIIRGVSYLFG